MQNISENINKRQYIHLRLTSEYSLSEGILPLESAFELAEKDHMPALAITDIGNIFGAVKFAKAALKKELSENSQRKYSIFPIIGTQLYIKNKYLQHRQRVIALVKNKIGYTNLCKMLTNSFINCENPDLAAIDFEKISENNLDGLFILSGHLDGDIGCLLLADQYQKAKEIALFWQTKTNGNYFIELQKANRVGEEVINEGSISIAQELEIPIVATHPIIFASSEDFDAHEVRYCIAHNLKFSDANRPRPYSPAQYFSTTAEMVDRFISYPQALANTIKIAQSCDFIFDFLIDQIENKETKYHLPSFSTEDGSNPEEYISQLAYQKLSKKLVELFPKEQERQTKTKIYQDRLQDEINTINQMGYAGYYLVVQEFINWAKSKNIPVGPGRGSGAGSIAAYVLGITDIDPIEHGLLFERFLNSERISMPDFDIDFCEIRRSEVIEYVKNRHGIDRVANIVTYMSMAARASIKDCGRALGISYVATNRLSDLIPKEVDITLDEAYKAEPEIAKLLSKEPSLKEVWQMAKKLEGLPRNTSAHAAGILITPKPLIEYCPLYRHQSDNSDLLTSQFDMKDIENLGLVKFDFLGLATLTIIDNTQKNIRKLTGNDDFSVANINYQDPATYQLFQNGQTNSIFQCESQVCKDLEQRIKIENFEEITALLALNRPGPLNSGMVENYINVKHQKEAIKIFDERIAEILKPTYGVIIYQEQVMQIAQILAKYSLGEADSLRRAMGKKDEKLMAKNRKGFLERARQNQTNPKIAKELFDLIEKFAEYGFNKSHSAAYGLLAYQTAYLKVHYPSAFIAAVMTSEIVGGSNNKIAQVMKECSLMGVNICPPSINQSEFYFVPKDESTIIFGLGAIKGVGEKAINHLVEVRKTGAYSNFDDFWERVDRSILNKKTLEALIKAGAFDELDLGNNKPLGFYRQFYLSFIEEGSENENFGGLFEIQDDRFSDLKRPNSNFSPRQNVIWENEVLEFSWSGHLIDFYLNDIKNLGISTINEIALNNNDDLSCWMAGIIAYKRMRKTRNGQMMNIILEDKSSSRLELSVFDNLLQQELDSKNQKTIRDRLYENNLIFVYGKARQKRQHNSQADIENSNYNNSDQINNIVNFTPNFQAELIFTFDEILQYASGLYLEINTLVDIDLPAIEEFIENSQKKSFADSPKIDMYFSISSTNCEKHVKASMQMPDKIYIDHEILINLREKIGVDSCKLFFSRLPTPEINKTWTRSYQ